MAEFVRWDEPSAQEQVLSLPPPPPSSLSPFIHVHGTGLQAWTKLLAEWAGAGFDYHIDLHTAGTPLNSTWTYLDRWGSAQSNDTCLCPVEIPFACLSACLSFCHTCKPSERFSNTALMPTVKLRSMIFA